ncbi:uncharacterized protein [Panulirus ornatus]|uniref:uncharacterized protein isoform X4 n=1 Tax=Panulirus ornatus TaxID=150431 RepID=UPI003A8621DA
MAASYPLVKDDLPDENIQPYLDMVLKKAELETKKVAEMKFSEFKNRLKDLESAYSTALYELHTHMEKVISLVYSWDAEFKKDLDSCYSEEESKIKKEMEYLKQLQDSLNKGISDTKVAIRGSGEWMRGDTVDQQHSIMKTNHLTEVIYNIVKTQVKDVPPLRFVAKELETNMLCEKDRRILGYISTLSVLPSDLYLARIAISHENFIYKITVPEDVEDKERIQDRIKCELKQGGKMPVYMNPIRTSKNFGCSEVDKTDEEEQALDFSHKSVQKGALLLQDVDSEFHKNKNFSFEKQIYCLPLEKQVKTSQCNLRRGQSVVKIDRKLRPKNPLRRPNHAKVKSEPEVQKLS